MKESISYTFLLNIVITFIFICFAIVMGTFSYYKAFRANKIISQIIEKYEGYNCASKQEIATKLNNISYSTPFKVSCKASEQPCTANENAGFKILAYDLSEFTEKEKKYVSNDPMNSKAEIDNFEVINGTKEYQYGIYTYMYVDLPVISSIIRIPFFAKTDVLYEFRDFSYYYNKDRVYDKRNARKGKEAYTFQTMYAEINSNCTSTSTGKGETLANIYSYGYSARERTKYDVNEDGKITPVDYLGDGTEKLFAMYGTDECKTRTFSKS